MENTQQDIDYQWFTENYAELSAKYRGRFVVIKDKTVVADAKWQLLEKLALGKAQESDLTVEERLQLHSFDTTRVSQRADKGWEEFISECAVAQYVGQELPEKISDFLARLRK